MSSLHLGTGSEKPAEVEGQARLYSMKFCPFSHRIRLILALKKVPHNIVNINITNKPPWYLEINSEGTVPTFIDTDGTIVKDSTVIADYLDEKYPEPALYKTETKARDLELVNHYFKIIRLFSNCIHNKDKRPFNDIVTDISAVLVEFEVELKNRGTGYFGGEQPGMLDILMWPWVEGGQALTLFFNQKPNFDKEKYPNMMSWIALMRAQGFVQDNSLAREKFAKHIEEVRAGRVNYDKS